MKTGLTRLIKKDWVAVEMARRKKVFHPAEKWDQISLFGLFDYKHIKKHLKDGRLLNHLNYNPANVTYWVKPSKKYYEECIKPIVDKFTVEELQESF